jgi:hypothetical protein
MMSVAWALTPKCHVRIRPYWYRMHSSRSDYVICDIYRCELAGYQNSRHIIAGPVNSEEAFVGRRLWYRDSYGQWHEDRHAQGRSGMPAKWALIMLMVRWSRRHRVHDLLRAYVGSLCLLDYE